MELHNNNEEEQQRLGTQIDHSSYAPEWIGAVLVGLIVAFLMLTSS